MLTIPHCKESLSRAYITAVVGRARHNLLWHREFDYGVDGQVLQLRKSGDRIRETGFRFDFQTKSSVDWAIEAGHIVFDLEAKAYNDLVERTQNGATPFLLILFCLDKDPTNWVQVTLDNLQLQKCAYWTFLKGASTTNQSTQRIRIPQTQMLSPEAIAKLLDDIETGRMLP